MSILDSTPVGPLAPNEEWTYTFPDKITPADLVMPLVASPISVITSTKTSVTFKNVGGATAPQVTFWLAWFYSEVTREEGFHTLGWQGGDLAPIAGNGIDVTGSTVSIDETVVATVTYVTEALSGAGLLAPDEFDICRVKFDEPNQLMQRFPSPPDGNPMVHEIRGPLVDDIGGRGLAVLDAFFGDQNSVTYQFEAPGIGNHKAFASWGGTQTQQRDYIYGLAGLNPAWPITCSIWIKPHGFSEGRAESIFMREWASGWSGDTTSSATLGDGPWASPFVSIQMFFTADNDGTWGATVTTGGVAHTLKANNNTQGFRQRLLPRDGIWNHLGFTYDGSTMQLFCNGLVGPTLAVSGAIDYNGPSTGLWVFGGNRSASAGLDRLSASFSEFRVANIARPLSYFEAMYASNLRIV
jgi:hypothetical protein